MAKTVWTFTNQKQLDKSEFLNYFQRKVFRTIRKHNLLPRDKTFKIKKNNDLNTIILTKILETKFQVKTSTRPNISSANLSETAEQIFKQILKGNFKNLSSIVNRPSPLLYLSDREVQLYAKLSKIKGTIRKQDKRIQPLFQKFLKKNQDLELNILKSAIQLNEK
ncbi:hypothetical protein HNV12_02100 [Methanococcoides sp. SA1]|nr:hypothetical protein [Methanococcoides sp. SA1]